MKGLLLGHDEIVGPWVTERTDGFWCRENPSSSIGLVDSKEGLIAGVLYEEYNGVNCLMHVAATPGSHWLTREFLWAVFHYPFLQLNCRRVTGPVPASNSLARRFDEHLGFTLEATLKDAHPTGDLLLYVMHKRDCRWLELDKRKGHFYGRQSQKGPSN